MRARVLASKLLPFFFVNSQFYHVRCKTIETSIFDGNRDSLPGPLVIGTFEKRAPGRFLLAALLTLKANWFDTLTVKLMINNDVLLFSATNEETPYEQLLHCCSFSYLKWRINIVFFLYLLLRCGSPRNRKAYHSPVCPV